MGDSPNDPLRVDFDRQIKLEFHGSTVTSDAGLLAYRELDEALGLTNTAAIGLLDSRTGQNTQHGLLALLRQSLYSRLAGYEDVNDAERLCLDPAMQIVVGGRAKDQSAASYVTIPAGVLTRGGSFQLRVRFSDPLGLPVAYRLRIFADLFGT